MWIRRAARHVFWMLTTVLLAVLLGSTLVRFAPGFDVDERELDPRLGQASIQALRESRAAERNLLVYYGHYLAAALHGDLGVSRSLQRPVAELFAQRIPVTLRSVGLGLLAGWLLGLTLAVAASMFRLPALDLLSTLLSGALLCVPFAVLALLFLFVDGAGPAAIALVVFPRVLRYTRELLRAVYEQPHVLTAKAKGLRPARILLFHVLPVAAPQILALAGVSASIAFGAAIPIEAICDSPGIGQLAWQAALGRDLPLLVNLTALVTVITLAVNSVADLAVGASTRPLT